MMNAKPRVRLPSSIKLGDVIEVKTLISHVMETGQRRGADGKPIPRNIIHTFTASFNGTDVFKAEFAPGISANPYLAFFMKVTGPGDLEMTWIDDTGAKAVETAKVAIA
jgi:sulfur-oxidizing protein SoxZ